MMQNPTTAPVPKSAWQLRKEFVGVLRRELHKPATQKDARTAFFNYALGRPGLNKELPIVKYYFSRGAMGRHLEFSKARIERHNKRATEAAYSAMFASSLKLAGGHTKLALKLARPKFIASGFTEASFDTFSKDVLYNVKLLRTLDDPGKILDAALMAANGHLELAVELARPAFRRIGVSDEEIDHIPMEIQIRNDPMALLVRASLRFLTDSPEQARKTQASAESALGRLGYEVQITGSIDPSAVADVESGKGIAIGPAILMRKIR